VIWTQIVVGNIKLREPKTRCYFWQLLVSKRLLKYRNKWSLSSGKKPINRVNPICRRGVCFGWLSVWGYRLYGLYKGSARMGCAEKVREILSPVTYLHPIAEGN